MKGGLHKWIFAGIGLGVLVGIGLWQLDPATSLYEHTVWTLDLLGKTIFIGALKMLVAPLIFAAIVAGVTSLPSATELGRLGWKTLAYYGATTAIAVLIGLTMVHLIQPGHWEASRQIAQQRAAELEQIRGEFEAEERIRLESLEQEPDGAERRHRLEETKEERYMAEVARREAASRMSDEEVAERYRKLEERKRTPLAFVKDILDEMLQNPFAALATLSSLGIIVFALLLGIACMAVGPPAEPVISFFRALNDVLLKLTTWVMNLSPIGVFALMASMIASHGPQVFASLAGYVLTVIGGIGIHLVALALILKYVGKRSIRDFARGIREAYLIAFSTRSSAATLPVTMECVEENLGVPKKVSEFVLPIGATVNMDGTALYEGVAVIFLLQMFAGLPDVPVEMGLGVSIIIFLTAVLASVGAAAIPDAGLITMVLVATAVGLPEYYLVFIFSVDAFLDMFRTSTNVTGDAIGAVVLARIEEARI